MTVIATGKKGKPGSPKLDYDDDEAYDARARLTNLYHDRRKGDITWNADYDHIDELKRQHSE